MGDAMPRYIVAFLIPILPVTVPVWTFNQNWTFGPALAVAFLLGINLLVVLTEFFGNRSDRTLLEHRGMPTDVAVPPNPGARHAKRVEAPKIDPAGGGRKTGGPVTGLG
jgi:hypothetical protein